MSIESVREKAKEIYNKFKKSHKYFDIIELAEENNIDVFEAELPDDVSGIYKKNKENQNDAIYINQEHSENRKRFSIAHELGHYFLGHITGMHIDKIFRNELSSMAINKNEIEANNFAAELLMPTEEVENYITDLNENNKMSLDDIIDKSSDYFKVSREAMRYKLKNLGFEFIEL